MDGMSPPRTSPKPSEAGKRGARYLRQHIIPLNATLDLCVHSLPLRSISYPHHPLVKKKREKEERRRRRIRRRGGRGRGGCRNPAPSRTTSRVISQDSTCKVHIKSAKCIPTSHQLAPNHTYCELFCPNVSHEDMQKPTNTPKKMLSRIYPL